MAEQELSKDLFEFMQKMWNLMAFPIPGMLTPTVDVKEIERKIAELKADQQERQEWQKHHVA